MASMDYKFPFPSLKRITMIRIGATVLNQRQTGGIRDLHFAEEFSKWNVLKENLSQIVNNLPLPQLLLLEIWDVIQQLYVQIRDLKTKYRRYKRHLPLSANVFHRFYFNVYGEINVKKMVQTCIEETFGNNDIDDTEYFRTACSWCLEDCIRNLWNQMNEDAHKKTVNMWKNPLLGYWLDTIGIRNRFADILIQRYSDICNPDYSIYENLQKYACYYNYDAAIEYFWHKLTLSEKARYAYDCAKVAASYRMNNLLRCSLSHLSTDKQMEYLSKECSAVWSCFLVCPFDQFFFPTLEMMWHVLSVRQYLHILYLILCKMGTVCNDWFHHVVREFWCRTPYLMKFTFNGGEPQDHLLSLVGEIRAEYPDVYEIIIRLDGFPCTFPLHLGV